MAELLSLLYQLLSHYEQGGQAGCVPAIYPPTTTTSPPRYLAS